MNTKRPTANAKRTRKRAVNGPGDDDVPTELAFGSDGRIYVNAEGVPEESLQGRKIFRGFAMTPEEAGLAVEEIHLMALNVTIAVQDRVREQRRHKARKSRASATEAG